MMKTVLSLLVWAQSKLLTKAGIFMLGLFIGAIPATITSYIFYKDTLYTDERLYSEMERSKALELKADKWQLKAFNAKETCMKEYTAMATFFKDMEDLYIEKEIESRKEIDITKKSLKQ